MKKSALLAVSALSLGVVGLATFTPVVNAADPATGTAQVTVTVLPTAGIGGSEGQAAIQNIDFGSVSAGKIKTTTNTVRTVNNTANNGTLTVAPGNSGNLTGSGTADGKTIATGAFSGADGTSATGDASAWGINVANSGNSYTALNSSTPIGQDTGKKEDGSRVFTVGYGISVDESQTAGKYTGSVTYTFTVQ